MTLKMYSKISVLQFTFPGDTDNMGHKRHLEISEFDFFILVSNLTEEVESTYITCEDSQYLKIRRKYELNLCLLILFHSFTFLKKHHFKKDFF